MAQPASEKRHPAAHFSLEYGSAEEPGYHTLASLMGRDGEYAVFRKFSSLNMLNLMSMQAELVQLEHDYKLALRRKETGVRGVQLAGSFKDLHSAKNSELERVLTLIKLKLEEYSKFSSLFYLPEND